jgi:hypothetical protein
MKSKFSVLLIMVLGGTWQIPARAAAQQLTDAQTQVVKPVSDILKAAEVDDVRTFDSLVTSGFYMYDEGKRWDGDSIMTEIRKLHESGMRLQWKVTNPDVHIQGHTAWVAYLNEGIFTNASGATKREWLESAFLIKVRGKWLIEFVHSTPVTASK